MRRRSTETMFCGITSTAVHRTSNTLDSHIVIIRILTRFSVTISWYRTGF